MARRVWEYNHLATTYAGLPVHSVVIYLLPDGPIGDPYYEVRFPTGFTVHQFHFRNIKLWEVPPEVLKQQNLPGLLPLLPLTKGAMNREGVEEMIGGLRQAGREDLLPLGYAFSALVFKQKNEHLWLKERFDRMREIFEDSWAYQEMVQQGVAQGLQQGLEQGLEKGLEKGLKQGLKQGELQNQQRTLVEFVQVRFPVLTELAQRQAQLCQNVEALHTVTRQLYAAPDVGAAQRLLESLSGI